MKYKKSTNIFILKLEKGDSIIDSVKELCIKEKIGAGFFNGIGALNYAKLAFYDIKNKSYSHKEFKEDLEVANLTGNISILNNKVTVHCHVTLGDQNMNAISGHLDKAIVSATCEIFITKIDDNLNRTYNDQIGLNLLDLN